ncbi:hypothetical protein SOQ14_00670 [Erythrobacter sp. T5W1-R]|uniref:hypothetical protein n=1 Tax=Erythrobacter sp. T5W1-R TaxID=3101752 RepID=UPI002AFDF99B|nr:hypothetical protein [Erythrobacter sp. T5W1-R]MEA1617425.1 hypothetical protein [Erythrobacter sp. T5W1-R]
MLRCFGLQASIVVTLAACGGVASVHEGNSSRPDIVAQCKEWMESQSALDETESRDGFLAKGSGACISGDIDEELQEQVFAWLRTVPSHTEPVVVIRSGGGNAFPAIDIASALQEREAEVYVYDVCASACANYIYAGVRQRHSLGKTILLFHGGLTKDTPQEFAEVFDSLLSSPEGKYIENPDLERKEWVERAELYIQKQDKLLIAAGVDPVVIHGFGEMELSDLASEDCDPEREPDLEYAVFFSEDLANALGISPVTGSLEYRPSVINERLNRDTQGNKACLAPEKYFRLAGS